MIDFKIPIICGVVVFVLAFIIGLIARNPFLGVLIKSIISGAVFFGVVSGGMFAFKFLGIDFADFKTSDEETESNSVDIVIDEDANETADDMDIDVDETDYNKDDAPDNMTGSDENIKTDEVIDLGNNSFQEDIDFLNNEGNEDNNIDKDTDGLAEDLGDEFVESFELDDPVGESESETDNFVDSEEMVSDLKEKVGVDVTFEEVAKAIRTKLRDDDR